LHLEKALPEGEGRRLRYREGKKKRKGKTKKSGGRKKRKGEQGSERKEREGGKEKKGNKKEHTPTTKKKRFSSLFWPCSSSPSIFLI
jgi:hypothetical protein